MPRNTVEMFERPDGNEKIRADTARTSPDEFEDFSSLPLLHSGEETSRGEVAVAHANHQYVIAATQADGHTPAGVGGIAPEVVPGRSSRSSGRCSRPGR